jgi:putative transposase
MGRHTAIVQSYQDQLDAWETVKDKAPFNVIYIEIRCKYCDSQDISKYGRYKNVQLWWCKSCKRKFTDSHAFPGMKIPLDRVQSALSMYYKGISLKSIRKQLDEEYNYYPSDSTVYRWIHRSTEEISNDTKSHQPIVGDVWIAFEKPIMIGPKKFWTLDMVDTRTHFLLASSLSANRSIEDARILIETAVNRAHKIPREIVNRRKARYAHAVEQALGANGAQIQIRNAVQEEEIKLSVYLRRVFKGRDALVRGMKLLERAKSNLAGWMIYYNYYMTQESLHGKSPSQEARIEYKYESNRWLERV